MHLHLSHAEQSAIRLAALLLGYPSPESFCRHAVMRIAENIIADVGAVSDNNQIADIPSHKPMLKLHRAE